jgi:hypothetical protein
MLTAGQIPRSVVGVVMVALLLSACVGKHPDADDDIAWARDNGLDEAPSGWDETESEEVPGYVSEADSSATIVTRNYATAGTADELTQALTTVVSEWGWQPAWWECELLTANFGFRHPDRDDVLLDATLQPVVDGVDVTVRAVFDREGWSGTDTESTACFADVIRLAELDRTLPPVERLKPDVIEQRLTADEVSAILDIPNITSQSRDLKTVEYRVGDEWVLSVGGLSFLMPEFDGYGRDDVYLVSEASHVNVYRAGLGNFAVEISDYTTTDDIDVINRLADELRQ